MLTIELWQLTLLLFVFGVVLLFAVFMGGYMVFRTKHAQTGIPFIQRAEKKTGQPEHYAAEMFEDQDFDLDEPGLSEAAERIREQKTDGSTIENVMAQVTGKTWPIRRDTK